MAMRKFNSGAETAWFWASQAISEFPLILYTLIFNPAVVFSGQDPS
jgi:hypothetical protein